MITTINFHLYFQLFSPQNFIKMASTRTSQFFYIVGSSSGRVIQTINAKRRSFADGPFARVHTEVICITKEQGDEYVTGGVLYVPSEVNSRDISGTGHLMVKRVEVASWSKATTAKMLKFFFSASKLITYKGVLDIEALVGSRNAAATTAILFGKGGRNIKAIVNKQALTYTVRDVAPYVLHIRAYTMKDKLAVEIRLKKKIMSIGADLTKKGLLKKFAHGTAPSPKKSERSSQNPFAGLSDEEEAGAGDEEFPELSGQAPIHSVCVAPHETLAAKLQDAAARGEVFKEYVPEDVVRPECERDATESDDSGYEDMPALMTGMTSAEFFAAASSGSIAEWA